MTDERTRASGSGSETRKRTSVLQARFTAAEAAGVRAQAERAGTTVGSLIRSAVISAKPPRAARRPTVNHKAVARVLGELGRVAEAFRQAASVDDQRTCHELIDAAARDLAELRTACFEALGREP